MISSDHHLDVLKLAVVALESVLDEVVFIGGATISLYITEPQVVTIRSTKDVDMVVEVTHRTEYEEFCKKLRKLGFSEDISSGVICRFRKDSLLIDVMPTDKQILGFSNKWYLEGLRNSNKIEFMDRTIQIFPVEYLIAAKIQAFKNRGKGNFSTSHDIEDIVTIVDGRKALAEEILVAQDRVRESLTQDFHQFISNADFVSALGAHISDRLNLEGRKQIVLERMRKVTSTT